MYTNFITISGILERLLVHPFLSDLTYSDASALAIRCLSNVGSLSLLNRKQTFVDIEYHRGNLPDDYVILNSKLHGIRRVFTDGNNYSYEPLYEASGLFNIGYGSDNRRFTSEQNANTYSIRSGVITTGFANGKIEIVYYGLYITETGEILIPRDPFLITAIEEYIKKEHFRILNDLGKIPDKTLAKAEQEYCWAIGKVQSSSKALSLQEREALSNMLTRNYLVDNSNHYENGFENLTYPEDSINLSDASSIVLGTTFLNGTQNLNEENDIIDGGTPSSEF